METNIPIKEELKNEKCNNANNVLTDVFVCDDCGKTLHIREKCDEEYNICRNCLYENYDNPTGHCSAYCRISGRCDESC